MTYFRKLYILGLLLLMTTLMGCPVGGEIDCNDIGSIAKKENLIKIIPLQATYNQGDIVTLKSEIPSMNNYYGNQINLFGQTNDYSALLVLGFNQLFTNNELTFVKGSQNSQSNWFDAPYNPNTGNYELEIKIKLNRTGQYSFYSADSFEFQGNKKCNRFRLDTNVEGINQDIKIEFIVQ